MLRCVRELAAATVAVLLVGAGVAAASGAGSLKLTPSTVTRGMRVTLSGSTPKRCKPGSKITIYSSAFAGKPIFDGFQAVVTKSHRHRKFSATAKTNKHDRPGKWGVFARCSGKNFADVFLNVVK